MWYGDFWADITVISLSHHSALRRFELRLTECWRNADGILTECWREADGSADRILKGFWPDSYGILTGFLRDSDRILTEFWPHSDRIIVSSWNSVGVNSVYTINFWILHKNVCWEKNKKTWNCGEANMKSSVHWQKRFTSGNREVRFELEFTRVHGVS